MENKELEHELKKAGEHPKNKEEPKTQVVKEEGKGEPKHGTKGGDEASAHANGAHHKTHETHETQKIKENREKEKARRKEEYDRLKKGEKKDPTNK